MHMTRGGLAPWQQELADSIRTPEQLERFLPSTGDAATDRTRRETLRKVIGEMRLSITPHSLSLIDWGNPNDPLLRMAVPSVRELDVRPEELADPIGDETKSPVPFLTHRYPDRVLIYATFFCALFCRFCFRRTKTGEATPGPGAADIDRVIAYLTAHPEVEEAILTGGDPLTLLDGAIEEWLTRLRTVPSIRRIRIHTRVPVNLPSRITPELVSVLRRFVTSDRPVIVVTHFNHPAEIAPANVAALARLADAGIVLKNQHPLLAGVNDDPRVLATLYRRLADLRVQPYYLHQLDLALGTNHFRVPLERGREIYAALQGITGISLPRYVLDLPGGHGKVPVNGDWVRVVGRDAGGTDYEVRTFEGVTVKYREPSA